MYKDISATFRVTFSRPSCEGRGERERAGTKKARPLALAPPHGTPAKETGVTQHAGGWVCANAQGACFG